MEIPESVNHIGWYAFNECPNLKKITIRYNEYNGLVNLLVNSKEWILFLGDQSIEFKGPEITNIKKRKNIKKLLKGRNFSFKICNNNIEDGEDKYDDDIERLLDEIDNICVTLPENIKNSIQSRVKNLCKNYQQSYDELRPSFNDLQGPINLKFDNNVVILKPLFISELRKIMLSLSNIETTIEFLKELNDYKILIQEGADGLNEDIDTKDIINNIIYISRKLGDKSNEYLDQLSKYIDDAIKCGSLEIDNLFKNDLELPDLNYITNFKLNVSKLYDEVKFEYNTVSVYMEILDSVSISSRSYKGGNDLIAGVGSLKYVIENKINNKSLKKELEMILSRFIRKYTVMINNILNDEMLLKTTNPEEIKTEFLSELRLMTFQFDMCIRKDEHDTMRKNKLLDELNKAKDIVTGSKKVDENSTDSVITRYIAEINNRWVEDLTINESNRKDIEDLLVKKIDDASDALKKSREELIEILEKDRNSSMDKSLMALPESNNELLKSLKESIEKSSKALGEEKLESYDWYFLALKVIFNYIASADTRIWNYLEENDNYVAASFKMRP